MAKYYRVKTTNFMWEEGAILSTENCGVNGYRAIDPIYNKVELGTEYISAHIIENPDNAEFFERVYPINLGLKMVYKTKALAKEMLAQDFTPPQE